MAYYPSALNDWKETFLGLVFPEAEFPSAKEIREPYCEHCGEPFAGTMAMPFVCFHCQETRSYLAWARANYLAENEVRDAIHAFKYLGEFHYRKWLGRWLDQGFVRFAQNHHWDGIVPVPLHPLRLRERGFNQARILAEGLGKTHKIPIINCLKRIKLTSTQTTLTREERWQNLRSAFALKTSFDVKGKNLLLIDDVFTTGATCEGCAYVLHRAGTNLIAALTVARG